MAVAPTQRAHDWLDRSEYPFEPHYLAVDGGQMHYVDEGAGPPVVFVHGNPTWSYLFRGLIKDLSMRHRCIAMDHIGFGLSDKPEHWGYTPELHARNLATLLERLALPRFTLVTHGFGGPIGISYAVEHPAHVSSFVAMNTWMWSLREHEPAKKYDRGVSGALGKLNLTVSNPAAVLIPRTIADHFKFPERVVDHYKHPFDSVKQRNGPLGLARAVLGTSVWQAGLWARKDALAGKPALILWGMKDRLFTPALVPRWRAAFPEAKVVEFADSGHFVCEEASREVEAEVFLFVDGQHELSRHQAAIMTFDENDGQIEET